MAPVAPQPALASRWGTPRWAQRPPPTHRMVISKIWLSLLCSSVACNTDTEVVSARLHPEDHSVANGTNTPVTGHRSPPGQIQSRAVTVHLSPTTGTECGGPRLTRAPQWAAISSNGAFWNFSTTCRLRSLSCSSTATLSTEAKGTRLSPCRDHPAPCPHLPAASGDLGNTRKATRRSPASGFRDQRPQGHPPAAL